MLVLYILGCFVLETVCRQSPAVPTGLAVYRTANPGQFLVQPINSKVSTEIPQGYSQIAVVVIPRHPSTILHEITQSPLPEPTTEVQDQSLYSEVEHEAPRSIKSQTLTYEQLLSYAPVKKRIYIKPKNPIQIQQFLKEVTPTTRTMYSEQQAASLRYAQATPPPHAVEQEVQRLQPQRILQQPIPVTYTVQPETQNDSNQLRGYQQIVQRPQLIHIQPNIQPQQFIQPYPYQGAQLQYIPREQQPQPKYQQIQPQTTQGTLTYIPINPVMFQKPLVDDDAPSAKSTIYVSQKTAIKKYQAPQPVAEEETEENSERSEPPPGKEPRIVPQHLIPLPPQQILIPIIPQQPPFFNEGLPPKVQPEFLRYQIQPIQAEHQQARPEPVVQQQIYVQIRPKKVPQQLVRQPFPQNIVGYQPIPIQQLQPADPAAYQKPATIRYILQPQVLTYQPIQHVGLRPLPSQQESLDYESPQEDTPQQPELQEEERNEEKSEAQPPQPIQRPQIKRKKTGLRSRKYRPSRVQQESEEEIQNENQDSQSNNQEEFRIQYPDGLKSQATSLASLRFRRPIQTNSRQILSANKDRAVQIIDKEDEEYK